MCNMGMRLAGLLLAIAAPYASAQVAVEVPARMGDDPLGGQMAHAIREGVASSKTMRLDQSGKGLRIKVMITSFEPGGVSTRQTQTVYSVVLLLPRENTGDLDSYLVSYTGICGAAKIQSCGNSVVAMISERADEIARILATGAGK